MRGLGISPQISSAWGAMHVEDWEKLFIFIFFFFYSFPIVSAQPQAGPTTSRQGVEGALLGRPRRILPSGGAWPAAHAL